ncbi:MAG: DUF3800 domain-containing protein [Thermodesulfobacteriota bacterium]
MRSRTDIRPIYTFGYVDESGISNRWFVCGLLVHGPKVSGIDDVRLNKHIRSLKVEAGIAPRGDFGWKKIPTKPGKYMEFYKHCIKGFFRHPKLAFHAIVIDTHRYPLDSKTFFHGSRDVGMDAFAFHLIRSVVVHHLSQGEQAYMRFDQRSRPEGVTLAEVSRRLTSSVQPGVRFNLRSVVGGRHPLLQVTDLLLGCVAGALNGNITSSGRVAILDMLSGTLGRNPAQPTGPSEKKFNVWLFEASIRSIAEI